ncbi:hypothetical protein AOLI_G00036940 [Acnodon oligacanthus]
MLKQYGIMVETNLFLLYCFVAYSQKPRRCHSGLCGHRSRSQAPLPPIHKERGASSVEILHPDQPFFHKPAEGLLPGACMEGLASNASHRSQPATTKKEKKEVKLWYNWGTVQ